LSLIYPSFTTAFAWVISAWNYKAGRAASYIERIGTDQFFQHQIDDKYSLPGKPLHGISTIQQVIKFNRSECTLVIQKTIEGHLQSYDDQNRQTVKDYADETAIRLGSTEDVEIDARVKADIFSEMKTFEWTSNAFHIFIALGDGKGVHWKITRASKGDFPSDMGGNIAKFHVLSERPISEFVGSLLYLDRWCGNKKSPRVIPPQ
jgi:hypothetical protein